MPDASFPLRVLVIEPLSGIGTALLHDLHRLNVATEATTVITNLAKARASLQTAPPHVVFVSLDMPNDGAIRLLKEFPREERSFIAILLTTPDLDKYIRPNLLTDVGCVGYLVKGAFGDEELLHIVEKVRKQVQTFLVEKHKGELMQKAMHLSSAPLSPKQLSPKQLTPKLLASIPQHFSEDKAATNGTVQPTQQEVSFVASVKQDGIMIEQEILWEQVIYMKSDKNYLDVWYFPEPPQTSDSAEIGFTSAQHILVRRDKINIPETFVKPHRSIWVNGTYIIDVRTDGIRVATGTWFKVSTANRQRLMEVLEWHSEPLVIANELIKHLKDHISKQRKETKYNKRNDGGGRSRRLRRKNSSLA